MMAKYLWGVKRAGRRGANAVEFALTLPIFLTLMLGIMDYGYLMMAQAILDAAAMQGTREGAITDPNVASVVTTAENGARDVADFMCAGDCTYSCVDLGSPPAREVLCTLTWDIDPLVGLVPFPNAIGASGRQLLEWQRAR